MARPRSSAGEQGTTYIEITMMMLITTIAIVAIANGIRVTSRGVLAAKERSRGLAIARDKLEEVKNLGYQNLENKFSNYLYPDNPDPSIQPTLILPIHQKKDAAPYPATVPNAADDPWTPEQIQEGRMTYWRPVKVKFVAESAPGQELQQFPVPNAGLNVIGGNDTGSNLAYIEVDVTWY